MNENTKTTSLQLTIKYATYQNDLDLALGLVMGHIGEDDGGAAEMYFLDRLKIQGGEDTIYSRWTGFNFQERRKILCEWVSHIISQDETDE